MKDERDGNSGTVNRRSFLKSGALGAGAAVTLAGCGRREESLLPILVSEDTIIPGTDRWVPSTCGLCTAGCGILVRTMMGEATVAKDERQFRQLVAQAKKIEGNPRHPVNQGGTCALGQAAPQVLYHPDRIKQPLRLAGPRGSGKYSPISWDEAFGLLVSKLVPLVGSPSAGGLAAIAGVSSSARVRLLGEFLAAVGSSRVYMMEEPGLAVLREANRRMYGRDRLEQHDLENALYFISFGANILESHTSPVRYNRGLSHFRRGRPGLRGKFVQVESRFSLSAANADEWLGPRPGTEGKIALAMTCVILNEGLSHGETPGNTANLAEFSAWVLENYAPDKVAHETDVPAHKIERIAREFARHQPGFALAGGAAVSHSHGLFTATAVQALNAVVGCPGRQGGISWLPVAGSIGVSAQRLSQYWGDRFLNDSGLISVLLLWDSNPLYCSPAGLALSQALDRIPFVVSFATLLDETSTHADLILPDRTFLEVWDVVEPSVTCGPRALSIVQPAVHAMHESRDRADVLLSLAARLGGAVGQALLDGDFSSYLKRRLERSDALGRGSFVQPDGESFWSALKEEGVWFDAGPEHAPVRADLSAIRELAEAGAAPEVPAESELYLVPFATVGIRDGVGASLPWMQEMPDPMTSVAWGSWAEIHPHTAQRLGIKDGEWIWLVSRVGRMKVPALISPAARPDIVGVPFGQGHGFSGRYATARGANAWEIIEPHRVGGTGEPAWAATRVRIERTGEWAPLVRLGHDRNGGAHA